MVSVNKPTLDIEATHSCNWRCCFGCRSQTDSPREVTHKTKNSDSPSNESELDITVSTVYHKHQHHAKHEPSKDSRSPRK